MSEDVTVEAEVDSDELEVDRDDAELVGATSRSEPRYRPPSVSFRAF